MKILMVGLGAIGQRHLRNLRQLMGPELDILAFRFLNKSKVLSDSLKIENDYSLEENYNVSTYTDIDVALSQKPDAVFICNPSSLHIPIALKAAQLGCNLFIEKPLSHNMDQVEELIDLVERKKSIAVVGYQMRYHPCLQRLRSILQEQTIGQIFSVRVEVGEYLPGWHTYEDYRDTYAARQDMGGGALLSQIHEMDYLYWLFGLPGRVYSVGGHLSNLEIDVEDIVETLMDCEFDGHPISVSLHQDFVQRPPRRTCEIIGYQGKVLVNLVALSVEVFNGEGKQVETTNYSGFQRNQMFLDELINFLTCMNGTPASLVSLREAAQSLRMALAAKESLATGRVVELRKPT